jgi:hypothetical protein
MIVSKLRKLEGEHGPYLTGTAWYDVPRGTILVLKKNEKGEYELREQGPRLINTSDGTINSFHVSEEENGITRKKHGRGLYSSARGNVRGKVRPGN